VPTFGAEFPRVSAVLAQGQNSVSAPKIGKNRLDRYGLARNPHGSPTGAKTFVLGFD
jgi:hypothetical protein